MAKQDMAAQSGNGGFLDSYFSISARGSSARQELLAGLTTFLAMVYSIELLSNLVYGVRRHSCLTPPGPVLRP